MVVTQNKSKIDRREREEENGEKLDSELLQYSRDFNPPVRTGKSPLTMPETEQESCNKEWLQSQLRSLDAKDLILLDCRGSHEYSESHIRGAVNLCIPSIVLRRLANGKIDLASTVKSPELKERIQTGYKLCLFILYNGEGVPGQNQEMAGAGAFAVAMDSIISILHRRLKQDGCRVVALQGESSLKLWILCFCKQKCSEKISRNVGFLSQKYFWGSVLKPNV